jgi:hypothetical protein
MSPDFYNVHGKITDAQIRKAYYNKTVTSSVNWTLWHDVNDPPKLSWIFQVVRRQQQHSWRIIPRISKVRTFFNID